MGNGSFVMDWLEFTYGAGCSDPERDLWSEFIDIFPEFIPYFDNLIMLEKGMHWYSTVLAYGSDFKIMFHGERPEMGVHVQFPGHSMPVLADIFGLDNTSEFVSVIPLFKKLKERGCKISRLDICYDDFNYRNNFTPFDFNRFLANKRISTNTKKMQFITSTQTKGATFYCGARGGDRYLRIYDKNYESNGEIDSVRYEMQLRGERANAIFEHVADGKGFSFADLLADMMNVMNEYDLNADGKDSSTLRHRKMNAGVLKEWTDFLEEIKLFVKSAIKDEEIVIDRKKVYRSLDKSVQWIKKYVLPTLYTLKEVYGEKVLLQAIDEAEDRVTKTQEAILKSFEDYKYKGYFMKI